MNTPTNNYVSRTRRCLSALVDLLLCAALIFIVGRAVNEIENMAIGSEATEQIARWKSSRAENGVFDYPRVHEAPPEIRDAFQRTQDIRKGMIIAIFLLLGVYHVGFETSRWKRTPGKWFLGLTVTDRDGRRIGFYRGCWRYCLKLANAAVCGLPLFLTAGVLASTDSFAWLAPFPALAFVPLLFTRFTKNRGPVHDVLSGTVVQLAPRPVNSAQAVAVSVILFCALFTGCSEEQRAARKQAKALKADREKAEQGDVEMQFFLGSTLALEQPLENYSADYAEGAKWLRRAAEQDHLGAQVSLAELLEYGKPEVTLESIAQLQALTKGTAAEILNKDRQPHAGFPADPQDAARWYRKAAERGHAIAQAKVAQMYLDGRGVVRDPVEALRWFTAVSGKDPEARLQADRLRAELRPEQVAEAERRSATR